MSRRLTLILLFVLGLPVVAQAQRLVTRIQVVGDVPAGIVTSQTALVEGRTYSDRDLDVAVARIRRLPFVYDARYTMDGGTLVIEVTAVSRFFGEVDASGTRFEHDETGVADVGAGGRMFLGSNGVGRARVGGLFQDHNSASVIDGEYSHYGIGGTRLFAIAGVSQSFIREEETEADPTWRLTVGYPLTVRQTLRASAVGESVTRTRRVQILPDALVSEASRQTFSLGWTYDTTDDPFFARSGEVINAGPSLINEDSVSRGLAIFAPDGPILVHTTRADGTGTRFAIDATKFWRIGARGTVFAGLSSSRTSREFESEFQNELREFDVETLDNVLSVGYGHNLFDSGAPVNAMRHRLEFGVALGRHQFDQSGNATERFDQNAITAGYVMRNQFATVRLNLSYTTD